MFGQRLSRQLVDERHQKPWHQIYQGTLLSQKFQRGDKLSKGECISLDETVTIYRQRLYDIS
jgi:hypothetical protein